MATTISASRRRIIARACPKPRVLGNRWTGRGPGTRTAAARAGRRGGRDCPIAASASAAKSEELTEAWMSAVDSPSEEAVVTLDLSLGEAECARLMAAAAERGVGFFRLEGTGIPAEELENFLALHSDFFRQDTSLKDRFRAKSKLQEPMGYRNAQVDGTKVDASFQTEPCFRECFELGKKRTVGDLHGLETSGDEDDYLWLDDLSAAAAAAAAFDVSDFKERMESYHGKAFALSRRLHRVVALSLGLPANDFDKYYERPLDFLLLNHYPPTVRDPSVGHLGLGAHCDFAFTTLLLTDGVEGLQICKDKTRPEGEREWVTVPFEGEPAFVVNFGDALECLSNGRCVSVLHRVANISNKERRSAAFFCEPSADATIVPLVQPGEERKFQGIPNYKAYIEAKFKSIGSFGKPFEADE